MNFLWQKEQCMMTSEPRWRVLWSLLQWILCGISCYCWKGWKQGHACCMHIKHQSRFSTVFPKCLHVLNRCYLKPQLPGERDDYSFSSPLLEKFTITGIPNPWHNAVTQQCQGAVMARDVCVSKSWPAPVSSPYMCHPHLHSQCKLWVQLHYPLSLWWVHLHSPATIQKWCQLPSRHISCNVLHH